MSRVTASLKAMSRGLGEKPWVRGAAHELADIAAGWRAVLSRLPLRPHRLARRPQQLARLDDKLAARKSFVDTVPAT